MFLINWYDDNLVFQYLLEIKILNFIIVNSQCYLKLIALKARNIVYALVIIQKMGRPILKGLVERIFYCIMDNYGC